MAELSEIIAKTCVGRRSSLKIADRSPVRARITRQAIDIKSLLEWSFAQEQARVEFDGAAAASVDPIYRMMQYGALFDAGSGSAARIDGGGWTPPPVDAETVAAAVAALPSERGGRSMAVTVAEHARSCRAPDALRGAVPRLEPVSMRHANQYGQDAHTARAEGVCGLYVWETVRAHPRWKGQTIRRNHSCRGLYTPCRWVPTQDQIAAARRLYLDWWGALAHLQVQLRGTLDRWDVTDAMPPMTPWA